MTVRQKVAGLVIDELQKTAVKGTALKRILALLLAGGAGAGLASSGIGEDALGQLGNLFKAPGDNVIPGSDQFNMGKIRNLGQSAGTGAASGLRGLLSNLGL